METLDIIIRSDKINSCFKIKLNVESKPTYISNIYSLVKDLKYSMLMVSSNDDVTFILKSYDSIFELMDILSSSAIILNIEYIKDCILNLDTWKYPIIYN